MYLAVIKDVSEAEQDELVGLFSRKVWTEKQVAWFWMHHAGSPEGVNVQDVEGYKEIIEQMMASLPKETRLAGLAPEERVAGLAPEERVAGLTAAERLAGLSLEQQLLVLPDEVLRITTDLKTRLAEVQAHKDLSVTTDGNF